MRKRERLTRYTRVRDAHGLLSIENIVAHESDTLAELASKVAAQPSTRTIVVLGDEGRLVGLIPINQLVDDIFFHITPEEYVPDKADYKGIAKQSKGLSQVTARDIMHPPVWTTPDETIKEAFGKMRDTHLSGLPVLDHDRLVGYVDVAELLVCWLHAGPD